MTRLSQVEAMRAAGLAAPALRAGRVTRKIKALPTWAAKRAKAIPKPGQAPSRKKKP